VHDHHGHQLRPGLVHILIPAIRRLPAAPPPASPAAWPVERAGATAAARRHRRPRRRPARGPRAPSPSASPARQRSRPRAGRQREQRQCIKGPLAHPQPAVTCLQSGGVKVALLAWQMIVALGLGHLLCSTNRAAVEVHKVPVRRGMRKHDTATAPRLPGRVAWHDPTWTRASWKWGTLFYPDLFFPQKSGGENLARVKAVFIDFQSFKDFPVAKRHERQ